MAQSRGGGRQEQGGEPTEGARRRPNLLSRILRRQLRRLTRRFRPPVRVVYNPGYEGPMPSAVPHDPLRADRVLAFLDSERLLRRDEISIARTAAMKNVLLVHTPEYLDSLQQPGTLQSILGCPCDEQEVEEAVDLQRLAAGGTIQATRLALESGAVAVNLGGGYHHASASRGMGFCIFNDLAIAIRRLRARGYSQRIMVVDLDLHDGNGTREIFADDPSVHTYSIHNAHWGATEAVEATSIALGPDVDDDTYLETLLRTLPEVVDRFAPALAIYEAGCDVAHDDRIGNWRISDRGILARDRFVVELLRTRGVPIAIVLGGGYGDLAWRHSARFAAWLLSGAEIEPPPTEELTLLRFRQIKQTLDPVALTDTEEQGDGWSLTEEDLVGILPGVPRQTRFLGTYSKVGLELMLERFGILAQLRSRGFRRPVMELDLDHPLGQTMRLFGSAEKRELLVEMRVARSTRALPGMELLVVEWLLLQNPRADFTAERPQLPGQKHPGLGMLREFFALLVVLAESLDLDGLLFSASTYHVAALSSHFVAFLKPEQEARFLALGRALEGMSLDEASIAVDQGRVIDGRSQTPIAWEPAAMVVPVSDRLRAVVAGEEYERAVEAARDGFDARLGAPPG